MNFNSHTEVLHFHFDTAMRLKSLHFSLMEAPTSTFGVSAEREQTSPPSLFNQESLDASQHLCSLIPITAAINPGIVDHSPNFTSKWSRQAAAGAARVHAVTCPVGLIWGALVIKDLLDNYKLALI